MFNLCDEVTQPKETITHCSQIGTWHILFSSVFAKKNNKMYQKLDKNLRKKWKNDKNSTKFSKNFFWQKTVEKKICQVPIWLQCKCILRILAKITGNPVSYNYYCFVFFNCFLFLFFTEKHEPNLTIKCIAFFFCDEPKALSV